MWQIKFNQQSPSVKDQSYNLDASQMIDNASVPAIQSGPNKEYLNVDLSLIPWLVVRQRIWHQYLIEGFSQALLKLFYKWVTRILSEFSEKPIQRIKGESYESNL